VVSGHRRIRRGRRALGALVVAATSFFGIQAASAWAYNPITPSKAGETITMTGQDMTVDQVVDIARHGAKVTLSDEARQRSLDAYGLLLEGAREGVPIYWFNRGSGANRMTVIFDGDPLSDKNKAFLSQRQLATFQRGARAGIGPEVADEEIVRAMMAVRANSMTYEAASPQLTQMLLDLLNNDITPVVQSRGTPGEADLPQLSNVEGTMVGKGEAYYRGVRMPAARALAQAGLQPLEPFAADDAALTSSNAYSAGQAALLLHDTKNTLGWADLIYAMDLNGMNSSVTPLSMPVQTYRPFKWLNDDAKRVLEMLRGSYLFDADPDRIIQDPESLRASTQRQGAAWQAYAQLEQDVLIQINSSDHNPVVRPGLSPRDSWELSTPQFMQFYVKGGKHSHGQGGYILSNANWDPYPMVNDIEALTNAIANMNAAVGQRIQRFTNPFFTIVGSTDVLTDAEKSNVAPTGSDYTVADLTSDISSLADPVPAMGNAIVRTVEDIEAAGRLKVARARLMVDTTMQLLAQDLLTASYWMDIRAKQDPQRQFGQAPTAAWQAFRRVVPWQQDPDARPEVPPGTLAYTFLQTTPAAGFVGVSSPRVRVRGASVRRAVSRRMAARRFLETQGRERVGGRR
jgi:histidine ammonia-lyase